MGNISYSIEKCAKDNEKKETLEYWQNYIEKKVFPSDYFNTPQSYALVETIITVDDTCDELSPKRWDCSCGFPKSVPMYLIENAF